MSHVCFALHQKERTVVSCFSKYSFNAPKPMRQPAEALKIACLEGLGVPAPLKLTCCRVLKKSVKVPYETALPEKPWKS